MNKNLAIIRCTYNGSAYLKAQLKSFKTQTFYNWRLFIYDDQSTDETKNIITEFTSVYKNQEKINLIINKERKGFVNNFIDSINSTPLDFDFYALSDQDDIWQPNKLIKAIDFLSQQSPNMPALYCSRTELINEAGQNIGFSPLFKKKPSFSNAIIQNIAGGNTMVFNRAAHQLLLKAKINHEIVCHDWFIYQIISGAGGNICYDSNPEILYRQHSNNIIGCRNDMAKKIAKIININLSKYKAWNDINIKLLKDNRNLLSKENTMILEKFIKSRNGSVFSRLVNLFNSGVYRQEKLGVLALFVGAVLKKI